MKNIIKQLLAFVLVFTITFPSTVAFADTVSDLKDEKEEIQQELDTKTEQLEATEEKISSQQEALDKLDQEFEQEQNKLDDINIELNQIQDDLDKVTSRLTQTEAERDLQYDIFKERLASMYEYGHYSYLSLLFSSKNISEFFINAKYLSSIAQHDKEIVTELQNLTKQIEEDKKQIESDKAKQVKLKNEQETVIDALQDKMDEKLNLIEELEATEAGFEASIKELEDADKEVEQKLADYYASQNNNNNSGGSTSGGGGGTAPSGKLAWPAPGYYTVTSEYGYRIHPIYGTSKLHKGMDIGVPSGATLVAADSGTVVHSGWMNGYGNTVVIDHGGGMSTLYAHNTSILVSNGQYVDRGQAVSKSGATGNVTGPHLHFEVRINGSTTDPRPYLF